MSPETAAEIMARVQVIASEIDALRRTIDAQPLAINDRQYLSRCFDLLNMELGALRDYVGDLGQNARTGREQI